MKIMAEKKTEVNVSATQAAFLKSGQLKWHESKKFLVDPVAKEAARKRAKALGTESATQAKK